MTSTHHMTPAQAQAEIDKTMEEARKDPGHPYVSPSAGAAHEREVERISTLYQIVVQGGSR